MAKQEKSHLCHTSRQHSCQQRHWNGIGYNICSGMFQRGYIFDAKHHSR